ncbi:hypothetical protein FOZ63_007058, partial [Perkinsus olseni]
SLSRMGPDSFLAAAPFPLSETTQDTLTELAARMGGGLNDDLGKPVVKEAGALTAKNHCPVVEALESSSGANAVVAVEPDGSQQDARAAIVKRRSWKPLAPKPREPTASDVAGAEEAMRLLREAESKLIMVSSSSICASTAAAANSAALVSAASSSNVICRFGVIADVQHYRKSVKTLGRAVDWWNSLRSPSVDFVVNLADLIDGHNRGTGTQKEAMATVMEEFERLNCRDKVSREMEVPDGSDVLPLAVLFTWSAITSSIALRGRSYQSRKSSHLLSSHTLYPDLHRFQTRNTPP